VQWWRERIPSGTTFASFNDFAPAADTRLLGSPSMGTTQGRWRNQRHDELAGLFLNMSRYSGGQDNEFLAGGLESLHDSGRKLEGPLQRAQGSLGRMNLPPDCLTGQRSKPTDRSNANAFV
jgi:hypothetical protein